jgi:hypothetical protein
MKTRSRISDNLSFNSGLSVRRNFGTGPRRIRSNQNGEVRFAYHVPAMPLSFESL